VNQEVIAVDSFGRYRMVSCGEVT